MSLDDFLDKLFRLSLPLFLNIFLIFSDMKASWSSSSDSSSSDSSPEDVSTFKAFLSLDLEVASLDAQYFLVFCAFKARCGVPK